MKDLLSKEHCCYKIHTLLMKAVLTSFSTDNPPPYIGYTPPFLQENLDPPFYDFWKIQPPINKGITPWILHMIHWNSPNGEIDEGYIWIWSIIQTNRKQNASNREDFKH